MPFPNRESYVGGTEFSLDIHYGRMTEYIMAGLATGNFYAVDTWSQHQTSGLEYCVRVNIDAFLPFDEIRGRELMGTTATQICSVQNTLLETPTSDGHLISHDIDRRLAVCSKTSNTMMGIRWLRLHSSAQNRFHIVFACAITTLKANKFCLRAGLGSL